MAQGVVLTRSGSAVTNLNTATGTLAISHGGTNLTSLGSASQILGVNVGGTALEYKTLVAGSNVTITAAAGQITIAATGGGGGSLHLYTENYSSNTPNTVTGSNSFAIGQNNTVSTSNSFALGASNVTGAIGSGTLGVGAATNFPGQLAHAGGNFSVVGDAQGSEYIYRGQTTNNTSTEIFLDGVSSRLLMVNNSCIVFSALILARCTSSVGNYAGFKIEGIIKRDTGASSVALIGTTTTTIISRTNSGLIANITADTVNGGLKVMVTGIISANYNWVVKLSTVEEIG